MQLRILFLILAFFIPLHFYSQEKGNTPYQAGFTTLHLVDSSRIYKPDTPVTDSLHYRPLDLDIWYPSTEKTEKSLTFGDLFRLQEERANLYQGVDYTGITEELAVFLTAGFGLEIDDGKRLLTVESDSYQNTRPAVGNFPVIIYMAGYNGMGWENYRILEKLAENGFVVISIWSVGRYPGDMSNHILDTMEQVYDGEFVLEWIKESKPLNLDSSNIGFLGCSWGGMSAAILLDNHPEIKAMATLDGSETHYDGDTEQDDSFLKEIYEANLLHPEKISAAYLYMESDNKWDEFRPTGEYHYFKKTNSPKTYMRFIDSKHEDFTSLPSILNTSKKAEVIHEYIKQTTLLFFEQYLWEKSGTEFHEYIDQLLKDANITDQPFYYNTDTPKELILKGSVVDSKTYDGLSYVNIGVLNKNQGTVSNKNGSFELQLLEEHLDDTLRISMIGYQPKMFPVNRFLTGKGELRINLEEEISELKEVVVTAKKWKYKKLGNTTKSKFIGTGFFYNQLGTELGIKINLPKKPTFVNYFNFTISHNRLSAKILFRLNMYKINRGRPAENILTENIFIPIEAGQTGTITVDLKKYDIVLTDDIVVTLEWIANEGEVKTGEAIYFPLGLFSNGTYVKYSSQGILKKKRGMGIGFYMDVKY
ncbi:MAG: alpha/beta fold hydrolase [Eudoraea sp.]|uniref:alpha/beta fold hydrolase n=1 Tax=Eudoraea sp. TaxID=1979955 RepID=UPI003C75957B